MYRTLTYSLLFGCLIIDPGHTAPTLIEPQSADDLKHRTAPLSHAHDAATFAAESATEDSDTQDTVSCTMTRREKRALRSRARRAKRENACVAETPKLPQDHADHPMISQWEHAWNTAKAGTHTVARWLWKAGETVVRNPKKSLVTWLSLFGSGWAVMGANAQNTTDLGRPTHMTTLYTTQTEPTLPPGMQRLVTASTLPQVNLPAPSTRWCQHAGQRTRLSLKGQRILRNLRAPVTKQVQHEALNSVLIVGNLQMFWNKYIRRQQVTDTYTTQVACAWSNNRAALRRTRNTVNVWGQPCTEHRNIAFSQVAPPSPPGFEVSLCPNGRLFSERGKEIQRAVLDTHYPRAARNKGKYWKRARRIGCMMARGKKVVHVSHDAYGSTSISGFPCVRSGAPQIPPTSGRN